MLNVSRRCGTRRTSSECTVIRWRPRQLADRLLPGYRLKKDDGDIRLEKRFTWQSPSWSNELLKETTVRLWCVTALCASPSPSNPSAHKRSGAQREEAPPPLRRLAVLVPPHLGSPLDQDLREVRSLSPESPISLARQESDHAFILAAPPRLTRRANSRAGKRIRRTLFAASR